VIAKIHWLIFELVGGPCQGRHNPDSFQMGAKGTAGLLVGRAYSIASLSLWTTRFLFLFELVLVIVGDPVRVFDCVVLVLIFLIFSLAYQMHDFI